MVGLFRIQPSGTAAMEAVVANFVSTMQKDFFIAGGRLACAGKTCVMITISVLPMFSC